MIHKFTFFRIDLPDILECGEIFIYILSATKFDHDFEENTGSIFYAIFAPEDDYADPADNYDISDPEDNYACSEDS